MRNNRFCHLHVHTQYSLLDGYGSAEKYTKQAKKLGFEYLACTDHGSIDGLLDFQKECKKAKIKSVFGCEAYIVPDMKVKEKGEKRNHITLLIKNQQGWDNLCRLLTLANLQGFYYKPRIDFESLLRYCDGLVILSGCVDTTLLKYEDFFWDLYDIIGEDLYLEVMPHDLSIQKEINKVCFEIYEAEGVKLVATNDCHYIEEDDSEVQEVLLAVQIKAKWNDPKRWRFGIKGLHLRTADEMKEAFEKQEVLSKPFYLSAMRNTLLVAEKCCGFRIKKRDISLPKPLISIENVDKHQILEHLCQVSFLDKFNHELKTDTVYYERFLEEVDLIVSKKFTRYFFVVYELVNWCKENNIMVGPARGSVGGCLVAFLLDITTVDPIRFGLLFSRFISEDRIDFPDIDLDFEDSKRHLVREHLEQLYGVDNVAGVSTFMKMKGRSAIRDVARVFEIPYKVVDEFAKVIDDGTGKVEKGESLIEKALDTREGKYFYRKYPVETELAIKLEGQIRGVGSHAAACIVSKFPLIEEGRCNLINRNKNIVVNWDMEDCEYQGLMKLDLLGLSTLSTLSDARNLIEEETGEGFDFTAIELEDKKMLREFATGHNMGIFQFNSPGMTKLCQDLEISKFEDLVNANALYRPGPLQSGITAEFVERKKGRKWIKKSRIVEEITKETYGLIIYQEQIMQLANTLAGLPWEEADKIRKVIGKSKGTKELAKFKKSFVDGCLVEGSLKIREIEKLWDEIEEFGGYGFNKSHACAYSMISCWCQYLKVYYPTEFISACLTHTFDDKKNELVKEAYRLGLKVMTPKVGLSDAKQWRAKDKCLYAPFIEVKGIGEKTAAKCLDMKLKKRRGFFQVKKTTGQTKLERLLEEIKAFEPNQLPENLSAYFSFQVTTDLTVMYPKLHKLLGTRSLVRATERALSCQVKKDLICKKRTFIDEDLLKCADCSLAEESTSPVLPSKGRYNIAIVGEAPGKQEEEQGIGFVGSSGNLLWKILSGYGFGRHLFHITNCCKCYPSRTRTPSKAHLKACWPWLEQELKGIDCRLVLAFGNTGLKTFSDKDSGITEFNGTTEWSEKIGAWVCWCMHPASVLHNPNNKILFEEGIKNFVEKIGILGGID